MTIHFNADLRAIVGERVGMLHWIMDPLASGFIIAYDLSGNSVLISNFDVSEDLQVIPVTDVLKSHRLASTRLKVGIKNFVDKLSSVLLGKRFHSISTLTAHGS